jgi:predicted acyl esterase
VMLPDGSLAPWTSPAGKSMRIAGAAPLIPWSDLVYALVPNGRERDDQLVADGASFTPAGVEKQSFVSGLFADGAASGYYAPPGADPQADLASWYAEINAGEPYDGNPEIAALQQEIYSHHSAYAIDHSEPPAPTFVANGWSDDLFPPDEAIRFYNRTKAQYPGAPVSMMFLDVGHQRAANKPADEARYRQRVFDWFDHYVKGDTSVSAFHGVEAIPFTCDGSTDAAIDAPTWVAEHPGAVRYASALPQSFTSAGADPTVSAAIDPIAAGNDPCVQTSASDESDVATYRLPAATGDGYTLLGAPTITASLSVTGTFPEIAERLWDVAPDGTQTLVARRLYRPDPAGTQTFQLHPSGWHFAAGHIPKLELLGRDVPYGRASNGAFAISVGSLQLTLPTHEKKP